MWKNVSPMKRNMESFKGLQMTHDELFYKIIVPQAIKGSHLALKCVFFYENDGNDLILCDEDLNSLEDSVQKQMVKSKKFCDYVFRSVTVLDERSSEEIREFAKSLTNR